MIRHKSLSNSHARCAAKLGQGFTLIELLVVLTIASLLTALISVGGTKYLQQSRYHEVVRGVSSAMLTARQTSNAEGRTVAVELDPASLELSFAGVVSSVNLAGIGDVSWVALDHEGGRVGNASIVLFKFDANGGARGGVLRLSRGGRLVEFKVNWLFGTVERLETVAQ